MDTPIPASIIAKINSKLEGFLNDSSINLYSIGIKSGNIKAQPSINLHISILLLEQKN